MDYSDHQTHVLNAPLELAHVHLLLLLSLVTLDLVYHHLVYALVKMDMFQILTETLA
jgi:hypothetical protein